jgi:cytochrome P450
MLLRRAVEDLKVADVAIPRGDRALVMIGSANRDPVVYPDPDRFDPTRDGVKHLAFGGGPHFCLGAALGRLEGQLAIEALCRRLPRLRLAEDQARWRALPVFRGLQGLAVEF